MQLLLAIVSVLVAGVLVVLVPGACLVSWWRLDRVVPPPLVPAAALSLGLVPLTVAMSATLLLHLPIPWVAGALAVFVLASWAALARRTVREHVPSCQPASRARAWARVVQDLCAGEWLRGTPRLTVAVAVLGGLLALYVGFYAWNDSLYHIAQAQKLLALDHPTFANTLQFPDGSAHPGYLLPAWQETIALVAFVSRQDPVTVAWILPTLTVPVGLLAYAGLGWVAFRTRAAATVTALASLLAIVGAVPFSIAITNGMQPGEVGLGILAPLAIAMFLVAVWPAPRERDGDAPAPRSASRGATFVAMVAVAGLGMLNVGYLWVLGMGVAGYAIVWALRSPWRREVVGRHVRAGLAIALVAGVALALLYPGLSRLEGLGRSAQAELMATDNAQYEGENGADLEALLRGDPAGAFHLRADFLVQEGGLALLGLFGLLVPILLPRWPGGWYLAGSGLLVLGIALSDRVFPHFVDVVTLDQARRIERVLPLELGLAAVVLAVGAASAALWRGGPGRRVAAGAVATGATVTIAAVAWQVPRLAGYAGDRIVAPRVVLAVLLVLAAWVVVLGAGLVVRLVRRRNRTAYGTERWPTDLLGGPAATIALVVLVLGALPVVPTIRDAADPTRLDQVPIDMRGAELRLFSPTVADALRELPVGATVLGDPRSRNPYVAMAIAPVYVVSSVPRHTALTPENRVTERFELATSFFADELTPAQRRRILLHNHVDAVLVHPAASSEMRAQLEAMPGVRVAATGKNQRLYLVDRTRLR